MTAKDFVLSKYPEAYPSPLIDNYRGRNSYVICRSDGSGEYIVHTGAKTASKAWTDAKKYLLEQKTVTPTLTNVETEQREDGSGIDDDHRYPINGKEAEANARLICEAPAMYHALLKAHNFLQGANIEQTKELYEIIIESKAILSRINSK